jgi:hypothetical protein
MRSRLVLATVLALAVASTATGATAQVSFEDGVGDQRNMDDLVAPDITSVQVSNTSTGVITFRVTIASHSTLPPRSRIAVLFDLDGLQATGFNGFEYSIRHDIDDTGQPQVVFERWDEPSLQFVVLPTPGVTSEFASGVYTLSIPRRLLENTISFEFGMYTAALNLSALSRSSVDDAPNADLWRYELTGLPAPRLVSPRLTAVPARPLAGRTFTLRTEVRRSDTQLVVASASVTCTARLGSKRLRAVGNFTSGRARCAITVPRGSKGKTIRGTMTVRAAGARLTRTFSYRVG